MVTASVHSKPPGPSAERHLLWLLCAVQFTNILDYVIMMPLGPQFMRAFQITTAQFGGLVSAYAISAGASGLIAALYLDRFDRRPALMTLYAGFGLGTLLCAVAPNFGTLLAARVIAGGFGGVVGAVIFSIVADVVLEFRRGAAMGMVMSTFSAASVAGIPLGLFLANHLGWHAPFFLIGGLAFLILGFLWWQLPSLRHHIGRGNGVSAGRQLIELLTNPAHIRSLTFIAVLVMAAMMVVPYISPFMVKNVGLKETDLPFIYLVGGAFTIFSMNWIGRLSDRFGKLRVFNIMLVAAVVATLLLTHLPRVPVTVAISVTTLFMICMSGRFVPAMALITSSVEPSHRGGYMSVNSALQHLFSGVGAWLAGFLIGDAMDGRLTGYPLVGVVSGVIMLGTLWLAQGIRPIKIATSPMIMDNVLVEKV